MRREAEEARRQAEDARAEAARYRAEKEALESQAQAQIAQQAKLHQQDLEFERLAHQHPNLTARSVRRLFRAGYEEYQAEETAGGRTPQAFGEWLRADTTRSDPLYGAHFAATAPTAATGAPAGVQPPQAPAAPPAAPHAQPVPNLDAGAQPAPPPGRGTYAPEDYRRLAHDPAAFREHQARMRQQLEAELGHSIGSRPPRSA